MNIIVEQFGVRLCRLSPVQVTAREEIAAKYGAKFSESPEGRTWYSLETRSRKYLATVSSKIRRDDLALNDGAPLASRW